MDDQRYRRQTILPEIGPEGQEQLAKACVLIAGAGGLGSVTALYLAAAGLGHIKIADNDVVELSNLNRQIIHSEAFLGQPKTVSAAIRIKALNSHVRVTPVQTRITHDNIDGLLKDVNIIVDGSDNYETRQVLNRASMRHNLPFVYGGVQGFNAMVSSFVPGQTPCFECIVTGAGVPSDKSPGIIGPAAGIAASFQAMETIKLILELGKPLKNRMLRISGLDMRIHSLKLVLNPDCKACGRM
ncbi:MAG: HesA/MoeB/ThiF family protein [Desulfobacula sp.]|jgi:adenylyltransferase/sulfurtransferase